jgi:hypothetical protein
MMPYEPVPQIPKERKSDKRKNSYQEEGEEDVELSFEEMLRREKRFEKKIASR